MFQEVGGGLSVSARDSEREGPGPPTQLHPSHLQIEKKKKITIRPMFWRLLKQMYKHEREIYRAHNISKKVT